MTVFWLKCIVVGRKPFVDASSVPFCLGSGLSPSDAGQLSSYLLTRNTRSENTQRRIRQAGVANVVEFLDPLSEETPKGAWVLRAESSGLQFAVRSLSWPGFELKITANDARGHVSAYYGTGLKNEDLLFVL